MPDQSDEPRIYNGRTDGADDYLLPSRLQGVLGLLPDRTAQRIRDWLTGYSIAEIEEQEEHILGGDFPGIFQPPINPSNASESGEESAQVDPWDAADAAVQRIAEMYKVLNEAGVSEANALAIIADEVNNIRMAGQVQSGFAQIPVAGARAMIQRINPGAKFEDFRPSAGWPPAPIE